jgi:hypothetical protein
MTGSPPRPPRTRALLLLAISAGLGLRLWESFESSLWLDELHSLAHASPADVAGVLEHTHWDFHAPLFFVALHAAWNAGSPEALRILPAVSSLLVLVPLLVFARRSRLSPWGPVLAAALFATLPFQIQYGTELRPYAWLMLCSAAACCAAFTSAGPAKLRFAVFALAVAAGLWTHYLMALAVVLVGATRLLFLLPPLRRPSPGGPVLGFGWLVLAGALGAAAFVPWVADEMSWVVDRPEELVPVEAPSQTVTAANRTDLLQAPLKTLVPTVGALGAPWSTLAAVGLVLLAGSLGAAAGAWLWRALRRDLPPADPAVAMAATFAALSLLVLAMSIWGWARVSIRYLCISAWLWPLVACELLAAVRAPRARGWLGAAMAAGAFIGGVAHAGGRTHEDVRGAVAAARALGAGLAAGGGPAPLYTALLSQPTRFEHCTPYLAYARDLECVELKPQVHAGPEPPLLPVPGEEGFERPVVLITRRYLDFDALDVARAAAAGLPEVGRLRTGRRVARKLRIDETMSVWVLEPAPR